MDPVALNIMKYYPLPNQPGDPVTGRNNYISSGTANLNTNNTDMRVDRNFGTAGRGFVRYSHRFVESAPLQSFPGELAIAEGRVIEENRVHNFVTEYNQTLEVDAADSASWLCADAVRVQQPGTRLPPLEPRPAGDIDTRGRSADVPGGRREPVRVPGRQRSPKERVHELPAPRRASRRPASRIR